MAEKGGDNRDLIGDQIGWSIRQLIPPTPELKALDRRIMRALPRPIARIVALARFNLGLLPEVKKPDEVYYGMLTGFCRQYIADYGQKHDINTLLVPTSGDSLKIQPEDFSVNQVERIFRWDRQIEWAQKILTWSSEEPESVTGEDLKEAQTILHIKQEMTQLFTNLRPYFIKRGLPFPWQPKEKA